jgi:diamine N-acetyltransferase
VNPAVPRERLTIITPRRLAGHDRGLDHDVTGTAIEVSVVDPSLRDVTTLRLAELTADNIDAAIRLELRPGQERFVAPVVRSIAEAYVHPTAWPRVVVDDDQVVGFVMANFDPGNEQDAFRCGIWRLNVAAAAQGQGVGRFAVDAVTDEARRRGQTRLTVLWEKGPDGPEGFYLKLGFVPVGELFGEVVGARQI